jgi:hypothetical protein
MRPKSEECVRLNSAIASGMSWRCRWTRRGCEDALCRREVSRPPVDVRGHEVGAGDTLEMLNHANGMRITSAITIAATWMGRLPPPLRSRHGADQKPAS